MCEEADLWCYTFFKNIACNTKYGFLDYMFGQFQGSSMT